MQSGERLKAIIIGGGIGGITAGIALRQAGIDATVYERAPELREVGSGLPLFSNALRVLQKLGLGDKIEALGEHANTLSLSTWRGDTLLDATNEKHLRRLGTVATVVHRAELLALLVDTLGMEHVHLGAECTGFSQDELGVCAYIANGLQARGDVLVGADRSEEHTSELQSHSFISYAVFCLKKKNSAVTVYIILMTIRVNLSMHLVIDR